MHQVPIPIRAPVTGSNPVLNVAWHGRGGDLRLHHNPEYFERTFELIELATGLTKSDIGTRLHLVFETQGDFDFIPKIFPGSIKVYNIGINSFASST